MRIAPIAILAALVAAPACAENAPADAAGVFEMPAVTFAEAAEDADNWRAADPENLFVFDTTKGQVIVEALPLAAPKHVEQYRAIIRSGKYEGTAFHRVINGFMAQGGDIEGGSGLPDLPGEFVFERSPSEAPFDMVGGNAAGTEGYYQGFPVQTQSAFLAEMNTTGTVESWIPHCAGVMSTARTDDPNSANSQFFWMRGRKSHLDKSYTAWGRVISGYTTVKSIKAGPEASNGAVSQPDILIKAQVAADMGEDAPSVLVMKTDGPQFSAMLEKAEADDICSLPSVPVVVE